MPLLFTSFLGGGGGSVPAPSWPSATYWRFMGSQGQGNISYTEAYFLDGPGGSQLAAGGTALASSEFSATYAAAKAFDGILGTDTTSRWAAAAEQRQWLQYQMPAPVTVKAVGLNNNTGFNDQRWKSFAVLYSSDGTTWTLADVFFNVDYNPGQYREWSLTDPSTLPEVDLATAHRYWRLTELGQTDDEYVIIREFELLGATVDLTTVHGGTASASSVLTGGASHQAANAFDRSSSTFWQSLNDQAGQRWLQWDFGLGNEQIVDTIALTSSEYINWCPRDFYLEYSDNGTDWVRCFVKLFESVWTTGLRRTYTL